MRTDVRAAFDRVLHAQERIAILDSLRDNFAEILKVSRERLAKGDIAEMEVIKAEANDERFRLEKESAVSELSVARAKLIEAVGKNDMAFASCSGNLDGSFPTPDFAELAELVSQHPRAEARNLSVAKAEADLKTERSKRLSEPDLKVGYRHYDYTGQDTLDLSVSIALPLIDRNQGKIKAARENVAREEAAATKGKNRDTAEFESARSRYVTYTSRVVAYREKILPKMEASLKISQAAFTAGDINVLDVLDSYRSLFESRLAYLDELLNARLGLIELERLTGKSL